jgi:hypothetical protein
MPAPSDLIHQTATSTGTGNFTLAAVNGKRSFNDGFGTGGTDVFDYYISSRDAAEWERGTGSMSDATTLVRDTVIASSNANAAVSFSAGVKDVTNDIPAAKQVTTDTTQTLTGKTLNLTSNTLAGTKAQFDTAVSDGNIVYTDAIGVSVQAYDADLTTWAGITPGTGVATALAINVGSAGAPVVLNGAGGTPSAITLTNGTGLPVSTGISGLGTGVGTFLATPSYTNLAAAVTGSVLKTAGAETIWIPAGAMKPRNTNGAGASTYDSGATADLAIASVDFDTTTQEYAHTLPIGMPKSWNESTVTAQFYWTNTGGASTQTVRWSIAGLARSDDDALDTAFGTAVTVDDTWLAQNDMHISAATSAVTIGGTPDENDLVIFEITRVVASDNMAGDAKLLGVKIIITTNATNDA